MLEPKLIRAFPQFSLLRAREIWFGPCFPHMKLAFPSVSRVLGAVDVVGAVDAADDVNAEQVAKFVPLTYSQLRAALTRFVVTGVLFHGPSRSELLADRVRSVCQHLVFEGRC